MTQLRHNTRIFKIRHFGIPCQDSKDRPCPFQRPTPSFAYIVSNPNECSPLCIATIRELLTSIHLPPIVPRPRPQCWHLSPSTIVQFQHGHCLLPRVMVSTPTVQAQNSSNTLLAIKYRTTNKHCSLAYHSVPHRPHKPYPPRGGTCFMLHCMCIPMWQPRPTHKRCAMWSPHQSHISAVQQFPHIALAHALTQSQCPCFVHPRKKAILHVKFGLWMSHFVHSSITDAFRSFKTNLF